MFFAIGEWVLCSYGPLIYDAKCLQHRPGKNRKYEYWVHYEGWNKRWDEWVTEDRLLKYNDENLLKKKKQDTLHNPNSKRGKRVYRRRGDDLAQDPDNRPPENKEGTISPSVGERSDTPETTRREMGALMEIPDNLRPWLTGDRLQEENHIVSPASLSIDMFLYRFKLTKLKRGPIDELWACEKITTVLNGVNDWFYDAELDQHLSIKAKHPKLQNASEIYGVNHLLIFFARLPGIQLMNDMTGEEKSMMNTTIKYMLEYLTHVRKQCFPDDTLANMQPLWPDLIKWIKNNLKLFIG